MATRSAPSAPRTSTTSRTTRARPARAASPATAPRPPSPGRTAKATPPINPPRRSSSASASARPSSSSSSPSSSASSAAAPRRRRRCRSSTRRSSSRPEGREEPRPDLQGRRRRLCPRSPPPSPKRVHSTASPSRRRFISEQVGGERTFVASPSAASLAEAVDSAPSPAPQADDVVRVSRAATPPHQTAGDPSPATRPLPPLAKAADPGRRPRTSPTAPSPAPQEAHKPRSTPTSSLVPPAPRERGPPTAHRPAPGSRRRSPSWPPLECSKKTFVTTRVGELKWTSLFKEPSGVEEASPPIRAEA